MRRKTLAIAESCTGGLLGHLITSVPGASDYFTGGVIAYSDKVKRTLLGVPDGPLRRYGAVSAPVAVKMAEGVRRKLGTDIGVAITGIAGPSGGTKEKPVGLVYFAVSDGKRTRVERAVFSGGRRRIRAQAAERALKLLERALR